MSNPTGNPASGSGRIVVGVDGSASSRHTLRWAVRQAALTGQQVHAVIAWEYPLTFGPAMGMVDNVDWEGEAATALEEAVREALEPDDAERVIQHVVQGHPAQALLGASDEADLLVVGSRGHGGFTGMLLGSVSQHVVAHAHCPVVVVHASAAPVP